MNYFENMPMDFQLGVAATATQSTQNYVLDATINGDTPMNPFVNLMDNSSTPTHNQWLVQIEQGPVIERPSSPVDEEIIRAYKNMAPFCVSPINLHLPVKFSAADPIYLPPVFGILTLTISA